MRDGSTYRGARRNAVRPYGVRGHFVPLTSDRRGECPVRYRQYRTRGKTYPAGWRSGRERRFAHLLLKEIGLPTAGVA